MLSQSFINLNLFIEMIIPNLAMQLKQVKK